MRNKSTQQHESYGFYALTDKNQTVQPIHRVQGMDIGGDYTTTALVELANQGITEIKENTPVFSFSISGNQVAVIDEDVAATTVTGLQWLALMCNEDSIGINSQVVYGIGETLKYHSSGTNQYVTPEVYNTNSDGCMFNMLGGDTSADEDVDEGGGTNFIGIEFQTPNRDKKMIIRHVSFSLKQVGDPVGTVFAYIAEDSGPSQIAQSSSMDIDTIDGAYSLVEFTFTKDTYLDLDTAYHIGISTSGYTYNDGVDELIIETYVVTAGGAYDAGATIGALGLTVTKAVVYSLGWEWDESEFDHSITSHEVDTTSVDPYTGYNAYPTNIDILVPIRGISELQRTQIYHQASVTSIAFNFDVGGVATYEVALETDNHRMFIDDRKAADLYAVTLAAAGDGALVTSGTATIDGASVDCDTVTYTGIDWDTDGVYAVYWNGKELEQATTGGELNDPMAKRHCGSIRWAIPDTEDDVLAFTENTLVLDDVIRIVFNNAVDPTWASYRLTSEPGNSGGLYKGELDISLITDTNRPRVIEGLKVVNPTGDDSVIQILPGSCYLKNTTTDDLEVFTFPEGFYYSSLGTVSKVFYIFLSMEGDCPTIHEINYTDGNLTTVDEYDLLLAAVTIDGSGYVLSIVDLREVHRSKMHLIQTSSLAADLGRDVIEELGNEDIVERSLNKPIAVTADISAKDTDEELNVLIHEPSTSVDTEANSANITYNATTLTQAGKNFTTEAVVSVGDIIVARGSKAIISAVGTTTVTIYSWYGDIPPPHQGYDVYKGILKSDEMDDNIGVQVNLYTSNDRDEYGASNALGDKRIVIESTQCKTSSDTLSISTGGDGEMSFSLMSDNLRAFYVVQALPLT